MTVVESEGKGMSISRKSPRLVPLIRPQSIPRRSTLQIARPRSAISKRFPPSSLPPSILTLIPPRLAPGLGLHPRQAVNQSFAEDPAQRDHILPSLACQERPTHAARHRRLCRAHHGHRWLQRRQQTSGVVVIHPSTSSVHSSTFF